MESLAARLAREALIALFRKYPDRFVLIGGGALHFLYNSPRFSADLDLAVRRELTQKALEELAQTLERELSRVAAFLGVEPRCKATAGGGVEISAEGRPVVLVEFTGLVQVRGQEKRLLSADSLQQELIAVADIHALLFSKAAALLKRAHLKGRDVFDIWFLLEKGAKLEQAAFNDWLKWEELGPADIEARLREATVRRLEADLGRFLPEPLAGRLKAAAYAPLLAAARTLFAPFLEEA